MASFIKPEDLERQLEKARVGFDSWVKVQENAVLSLKDRHVAFVKEAEEKSKDLRADGDTYGAVTVELEQLLEKQRLELDALEKKIAELQITEQTWPPKLQKLRDEVERLTSQNESEAIELDDEETVKQRKADAILAVLEKYRTYLGLKFENEMADHIKMVFDNIDPLEHSREFVVVLHVTDVYMVKECSPQLPQLSEFLDEVNESNNFSLFVKKIRRAFKATCTST